jgi:hypothetical protein
MLLSLFAFSGCAPNSGSGSSSDAVAFANTRISELSNPTIEQDENGKWIKTANEVQDATPGFVSSTFGGVKSRVEYRYRILKTQAFDTKKEAESADAKLVDQAWREAEELYVYEEGQWISEGN